MRYTSFQNDPKLMGQPCMGRGNAGVIRCILIAPGVAEACTFNKAVAAPYTEIALDTAKA